MKKSQVVALLVADIEKNGDTMAPEALITALDSRPWIRREIVAVLQYVVILGILAGILR